MKCLSLIKPYVQKTPRCGTECGAITNSDHKMTIAATITNTTSATNYTSDSNFKL